MEHSPSYQLFIPLTTHSHPRFGMDSQWRRDLVCGGDQDARDREAHPHWTAWRCHEGVCTDCTELGAVQLFSGEHVASRDDGQHHNKSLAPQRSVTTVRNAVNSTAISDYHCEASPHSVLPCTASRRPVKCIQASQLHCCSSILLSKLMSSLVPPHEPGNQAS